MGWIPARKRALVLLGLPALLLAGCTPAPIQGEGYTLVFEDHFADSVVDPVWATAPFGGSLPATVDDGVLTLRTTAANDYQWGYIASTGPRSDGEPSYPDARAWQEGYFEARLRFTDSPWAWPAFWLFSMAKSEAWPGEDCRHLNAEWDIMENGIPNYDGTHPPNRWYFAALHRNTSDGTPDGSCGQPDEYRSATRDLDGAELAGWHTWSGHWTRDELCTYLDGIQIQCMAPYDSTAQPMHLAFTMQYLPECIGCPARPAALELQIDWVRVFQAR